MKLGYPCINRSVGCTANSTFRLASYSEEKMIEKITNNLNCLQTILEYNVKHNFFFFRISSDIIPFASHPICKFNWKKYFKTQLQELGDYIKKHNIRISMHPDQFVVINAKNPEIIKKSIAELQYHCDFLDTLQLDTTAKVQIHVGGVYGDKPAAVERFITTYKKFPLSIKKRLAIENDHNLYSLQDVLEIHKKTKVPIIFDTFHHQCLNNNETLPEALKLASKTWQKQDGILMIDYSSQQPNTRVGTHAQSITPSKFKSFIEATKKANVNCDVMLEIKDKEASALKVIKLIN